MGFYAGQQFNPVYRPQCHQVPTTQLWHVLACVFAHRVPALAPLDALHISRESMRIVSAKSSRVIIASISTQQ